MKNDSEMIDWLEKWGYVISKMSNDYWLVSGTLEANKTARGAGPTWRAAVNAAIWAEENPQYVRVIDLVI